MRYHELDTKDLRKDFRVFWQWSPKIPGLTIRSEYADLVCRKCKKLDVAAALERGISSEVRSPPTFDDALCSDDNIRVVSARARKTLESVPGLEARYYSFPKVPEYFAMFPVHRFYPPADGRLYTSVEPAVEGEPFQIRGRPCRKCGRFREVTFRSEWYTAPEDIVLAGVVIEKPRVPSIVWIGNQDVVEAIERERLTGFWIQKNSFQQPLT